MEIKDKIMDVTIDLIKEADGNVDKITIREIAKRAGILDKIQYENDVIFIVAGTNKTNQNPNARRIGAPPSYTITQGIMSLLCLMHFLK